MSKINLPNVRLSFPSLFATSSFGGEDTGKYEATFILDKEDHEDLIKKIQAGIKVVIKETLKGKSPGEDRLCLKDGDESEREELRGCYSIKASSKKRPMVIDRDKTPLTFEDERPYAGSYVNAIISLWGQSNSWGKRVNANLDGVQFCAHGEPFGAPGIEADAFDAFGSDDDDGDLPF